MTYKEFIEELDEIEQNLEKDENQIDFTMLKMLQSILKSKEAKEKNEEQQKLEQEVNEMVESIISRPEDYFESKERNIQKMIEKSRARHAIPEKDKDREAIANQVSVNTIIKLLDKMIKETSSQEVKFQLDDIKKELKRINTRSQRAQVNQQIKKPNTKIRLVAQKELKRQKDVGV